MRFFQYILLLFAIGAAAQPEYTISGKFPQAANKDIFLKGYGFSEGPVIAKAMADAAGNFTVSYPENYTGAALLEVRGTKSIIILLNKENFSMHWPNLEDYNSLVFKGSAENDAFAEGLKVYRDADIKRAGLSYLVPLYTNEPQKQQFFISELQLQDRRMQGYLNALPENSYARYYLNLRRFLADMPQTAGRYKERMPLHEAEFKAIDFSGEPLIRSGLYKELLDSFVLLMESHGAKVYEHLNPATQAVIASLKDSPELRQDVAEYLFKLFEQRSLFPAAEFLALSMLNDDSCTVDAEREALFEQYRKMAKGNTAPDIELLNSNKSYKKLSDVKAKYRLVVFGAGWCPTCKGEAPKLKEAYQGWKARGLEIIYISLDTDEASYTGFTGGFPWVTATDYKSWEGKAARDYYVIGTPTMYLLDAGNKILLKPVSPEQVSAWLELQK